MPAKKKIAKPKDVVPKETEETQVTEEKKKKIQKKPSLKEAVDRIIAKIDASKLSDVDYFYKNAEYRARFDAHNDTLEECRQYILDEMMELMV